MSLPATEPFELPAGASSPPTASRSRNALLKRLADVVCLPSSRINAFERSMTADLLVDMLRDAAPAERERAARRLCILAEAPTGLVRMLLRDDPAIARPLLEDCPSVHDTELIDCARHGGLEHRRMIAARRGLSEVVAEAVAEKLEPRVIEVLLRNTTAHLSNEAVELILAASRDEARFVGLLLRRPELRPRHAYVMFWWADAEGRKVILQRFAVSRDILQDAASDIFALAAAENWSDPLSRKALQFIERRQRNRAAIAKSPYDSLDEAVAAAASGMTREIAEEVSYLAGLKPMTGAKIFSDPGGEAIAILCKATGLPRINVTLLWRALRRPEADEAGQRAPVLEQAITVYDMIAVDRAQTVLRYWNWALSSQMTAALMQAIREGDDAALDEYSVPQRAAMLALSSDLAR